MKITIKEIEQIIKVYKKVIKEIHEEGQDIDNFSDNDINNMIIEKLKIKKDTFKEDIFEIAFGDDAINKGYTDQEVIDTIRSFSDKSLEVED